VTTGSRQLARIEDIPDGAARGFDPFADGEPSMFIVRRGERLYAYRDRCPHQGTRMGWRRDGYLNGAGDRIVCYGHGAEFDVETGRCVHGPCPGQALEPVSLEVSAAGDICISGEDHE
jgi:naringenin degradation protein FdeD